MTSPHVCLSKGYPPHDTGVNEGEAEICHQGNGPIETLKKEDKSQTGQTACVHV